MVEVLKPLFYILQIRKRSVMIVNVFSSKYIYVQFKQLRCIVLIIHTHSGNHSVYFKSTTEARSGHLNNTEKI